MQKSVKSVSELNTSHSGILDRDRFNESFDLKCYKPSDNLRPFIAYTWTQRRKKGSTSLHKPLEIYSGPNVYLFIAAEGAFVHGTAAQHFQYDPFTPGAIAGIKFKPGGFHPFYKRPMIRLSDKVLPAHVVFPEITPDFVATLLKKKDEEIVQSLEKILDAHSPKAYTNLELIGRIMKKIEEDNLQTVASVARAIGRSERAVQLLFHHHVGISLKWVINRKRLLKTIDKVIASDSNWTNAAAEAGYSNQSHFTREFKQVTGMSPSAYQKLN